jgi:hypothetical protein
LPVIQTLASAGDLTNSPEAVFAMKWIFTALSIVGALALLSLNLGCTGVEDTEDLLSQAGFTIGIMTDAQRQQLKPYKVTVAKENGETSYFYADPAYNHTYVGNEPQYQRFLQLQKQLWAARNAYTPPVFD